MGQVRAEFIGKKKARKRGAGKNHVKKHNQSKGFTLEYHVQEEATSLINSILNSHGSPQINTECSS